MKNCNVTGNMSHDSMLGEEGSTASTQLLVLVLSLGYCLSRVLVGFLRVFPIISPSSQKRTIGERHSKLLIGVNVCVRMGPCESCAYSCLTPDPQ